MSGVVVAVIMTRSADPRIAAVGHQFQKIHSWTIPRSVAHNSRIFYPRAFPSMYSHESKGAL